MNVCLDRNNWSKDQRSVLGLDLCNFRYMTVSYVDIGLIHFLSVVFLNKAYW